MNLTGLTPQEINAIASQRLATDASKMNMGSLLANINNANRSANQARDRFNLDVEKFGEEKRAAGVTEKQNQQRLDQTAEYYAIQKKYYEAIEAGKDLDIKKYKEQMKLFEKYGTVTMDNIDQIPVVDQVRMFGTAFMNSRVKAPMYDVQVGDKTVKMTGNQYTNYLNQQEDNLRQKKLNEQKHALKIAEINDMIERADDVLSVGSLVTTANEEGNNTFYWKAPVDKTWPLNNVPAQKVPLPVAENGHQLTMADVRKIAHAKHMSVLEYLKERLPDYFKD